MFGKAKEIAQTADKYFHDLAQYLQVMQGSIDLIKMEMRQGDIPAKEMLSKLEVMTEAAEKGCDKIREARDFMHGKEREAKKPFKYTREEFVSYLKGHITPMVRNNNLEYSLRKFDIEDKVIEINESFLYNTILNLAQNASHAGAKHLWNDYWHDDKYMFMAFSDDGSGMSEEVRKKCLACGYTTKPKGIGTGIGLSTLDEEVQKTGGCVDVASELGKGTTITLVQPLSLFYPVRTI